MKEKPILFSGPMVRAILEGRKTMTRRTSGLDKINLDPDAWTLVANKGGGKWLFRRTDSCTFATVTCPYGVPGDRLWVRETWQPFCAGPISEEFPLGTCVKYAADDALMKPQTWSDEQGMWCEAHEEDNRWRPSIHMPRWASRITLEVTGVRVERLREITEEDARAEGCKPDMREDAFTVVCRGGGTFEVSSLYERGVPKVGEMTPFGEVTHVEPIPGKVVLTAREAFRDLWRKINGRDSWDKNPWVWVVEFMRVDQA